MDKVYEIACDLATQVIAGNVAIDLATATLESRMQHLSTRSQQRMKKALEYIVAKATVQPTVPGRISIPTICFENPTVKRGFSTLTIYSGQARSLILRNF